MPLTIHQRLRRGALLISILDALRRRSGLSRLACRLEDAIISRELAELEHGSGMAAARKDGRRPKS